MQLQHKQADGKPLRDHLLAAAAAGRALHPLLAEQPPECVTWLWNAHCELTAARPAGLAGDRPTPATEVLAWQALQGVRLSPWDVDTLAAMDRAALQMAAEQREAKPTRRHDA